MWTWTTYRISVRYHSIVRETGGLNDTVQSYDEETGEGNGFSFTNFNAHDMLHTVRRAIEFYHDKPVWEQLVKQAMTEDYSWEKSALAYKNCIKVSWNNM